MIDSKIYAMDAICTHAGAPLEEGNLQEYSLTCPWHYTVFDVRNGKVSDATVWATDLCIHINISYSQVYTRYIYNGF